jgi:Na+/H+ antiporter NhaD/arsenite permease-like protein
VARRPCLCRINSQIRKHIKLTDNEFTAYIDFCTGICCTGTGGSALIIGSAAGIAAMGIEKINFFWYLKKISPFALIGFFAGAGVYLLEEFLEHF